MIELPETKHELIALAEQKLSMGDSSVASMRTPPPREASIEFGLIQDGDILCFLNQEEERLFL